MSHVTMLFPYEGCGNLGRPGNRRGAHRLGAPPPGPRLGMEQTGPIMSMMPILMVGVVFGLAMDDEVFLVTRMREAYVHGERPGQAVVTGFKRGARVVSAAGVIMIAVFAGFIGSSEQMVKMIGDVEGEQLRERLGDASEGTDRERESAGV